MVIPVTNLALPRTVGSNRRGRPRPLRVAPTGYRQVVVALALLALPGPAVLTAQDVSPDRPVSATERDTVIHGILVRLIEQYVFPDTAEAMARNIRARQQRGEYDRITSGRVLADSLTAHLQSVSRDLHLRVRYSATPLPQPGAGPGPTPEDRERALRQARERNFGFERVERLDGNVGYLEIRGFGFGPQQVEETAAAAFTFLGQVDALIIDVRRNGGGSPGMVALVSSYLFGPEPVHLNSLYWRPTDRTEDFYTRAEVSGARFGPDKPLYVLTSRRTFSAAEEFTYNLQSRQRAVIVGDTTGGGAHPGGVVRVTDHFGVWIPRGRAINPITGTNWEGIGVRPDVAVSSDDALTMAHLHALRRLRDAASDPERRQDLQRLITDLEAHPCCRPDARGR